MEAHVVANLADKLFPVRRELQRYAECFWPFQADVEDAGESREALTKVFDELLESFYSDQVLQGPATAASYGCWSNEELIAAQTGLSHIRALHLANALHTDVDDPQLQRMMDAFRSDDLVDMYLRCGFRLTVNTRITPS